MSKKNKMKTKNDFAWERIFQEYDILHEIERTGEFVITTEQIRECNIYRSFLFQHI